MAQNNEEGRQLVNRARDNVNSDNVTIDNGNSENGNTDNVNIENVNNENVNEESIELTELGDKNTTANKILLQNIHITLVSIDRRCKENRNVLEWTEQWRVLASCLDKVLFCLFLVLFLINLIFALTYM